MKLLFGAALFYMVAYFLLYSDALTRLDGDNLDGSSSLTWRSAIAAAILLTVCQFISNWLFRRRIALTVFLGLASRMLCWQWLADSRFRYGWEQHRDDGTFPLTWRSDLVLFGMVMSFLAASILIFWTVKRLNRSRHVSASRVPDI